MGNGCGRLTLLLLFLCISVGVMWLERDYSQKQNKTATEERENYEKMSGCV